MDHFCECSNITVSIYSHSGLGCICYLLLLLGVAPSKCFDHHRVYLRNTKNKLWLQCKINNWKDHGCTTHCGILRQRIFNIHLTFSTMILIFPEYIHCDVKLLKNIYTIPGGDWPLCKFNMKLKSFILNFLVLQSLLLPPPEDFNIFCGKNEYFLELHSIAHIAS